MKSLKSFHDVNYLQNPIYSNPDNFLNLNANLYPNPMVKTKATLNLSTLNFAFVVENKNNQSQNPPQEKVNKFVSTTPKRVHQNDCIVISVDEKDRDLGKDGKTHNICHKKFNPYICLKCKKVCKTSQVFASHVHTTHYSFETK